MSNDMESMRTFADQLWKYMVPKLDSKFASNVSYFRAEVVSNLGNNKLEVIRPLENGTLTLPCVRAMSNAQPGQQVVALVMGSMSNAIVVGDGNLNVPGGGGDVGIANFQAQSDGSLVITLTNGNTLTATPHDPTKQDVLTFDDVPTQGSSNPVKSGGVYTALDNKVDKVAGKGLSTNDFTNALKDKLDGIEAGAEVNQNAFSNVAVGSVTISADSKQDTLTLNAGGLVNITGDATNNSVTISVDPNHTHITTQVLDLVNADSYGPSGMVSFDADVAEVPLKNCIVNIEPVQAGSGTPSPTNVRAISGWTGANVTRAGKNLIQLTAMSSTVNGVDFVSDQTTGTVHVTGATTSAYSIMPTMAQIKLGQGSYIISGCPSSGGANKYIIRDMQYTADNTFVRVVTDAGSGGTITVTDETIIHKFDIVVYSGAGTVDITFQPMLRLSTVTDATFEPFNGDVYDVTFPSEAGTVYGGTLDVLNGTLTVDTMSRSFTGTESGWSSQYTGDNRLFRYNSETTPIIRPSTKRCCSHFPNATITSLTTNIGYYAYTSSGATRGWIQFRPNLSDFPDLASWKSWLASQASAGTSLTCTFQLETPITYQLSPQIISTLLGNNNIWADCGAISVDYGAFLSALDKAIEEHSGDDIRHITEAERTAWDGKANSGHTHDASDITSGILPAARGGTGNGNGYIQTGQEAGTTLGSYATAEGNRTTASGGPAAHAEGEYTSATGNDAPHAEGYYTKASGDYAAHAEGYWTTASGQYGSHAEGMNTVASGNNGAHAEGHNTVASGDYGSHADGDHTIAAGRSQHVFGAYNVSNTTDVEIVGWGAINARKNIRTLSNTGNEWIAGTLTQASDARLKDVQGSIPDLSSIRAVRFRWKNGDDKEHLGYLAQDVEGIAPYLVGVDSNGYKSLDYIALLTAKVEILEREIERLKTGLYS